MKIDNIAALVKVESHTTPVHITLVVFVVEFVINHVFIWGYVHLHYV